MILFMQILLSFFKKNSHCQSCYSHLLLLKHVYHHCDHSNFPRRSINLSLSKLITYNIRNTRLSELCPSHLRALSAIGIFRPCVQLGLTRRLVPTPGGSGFVERRRGRRVAAGERALPQRYLRGRAVVQSLRAGELLPRRRRRRFIIGSDEALAARRVLRRQQQVAVQLFR